MDVVPSGPDRRRTLIVAGLGVTSLGLPSAGAAGSVDMAPTFTTSLTFSDVTTTGFTVTWAE